MKLNSKEASCVAHWPGLCVISGCHVKMTSGVRQCACLCACPWDHVSKSLEAFKTLLNNSFFKQAVRTIRLDIKRGNKLQIKDERDSPPHERDWWSSTAPAGDTTRSVLQGEIRRSLTWNTLKPLTVCTMDNVTFQPNVWYEPCYTGAAKAYAEVTLGRAAGLTSHLLYACNS